MVQETLFEISAVSMVGGFAWVLRVDYVSGILILDGFALSCLCPKNRSCHLELSDWSMPQEVWFPKTIRYDVGVGSMHSIASSQIAA